MKIRNSEGRMKCLQCMCIVCIGVSTPSPSKAPPSSFLHTMMCTDENKLHFQSDKDSTYTYLLLSIYTLPLYAYFMKGLWSCTLFIYPISHIMLCSVGTWINKTTRWNLVWDPFHSFSLISYPFRNICSPVFCRVAVPKDFTKCYEDICDRIIFQ